MSALVTSNDTPRASVSGVVYVLPSAPVNDAPGLRPARYAEPPAETAIVGTGPPLSTGESLRNFGSPVKMSEEVISPSPPAPPSFITQCWSVAVALLISVCISGLPALLLLLRNTELTTANLSLAEMAPPYALGALLSLNVQLAIDSFIYDQIAPPLTSVLLPLKVEFTTLICSPCVNKLPPPLCA